MAVLDTNFLIALERGESSALSLHERLRDALEVLRVPAAVRVEYLCSFSPDKRLEASRVLSSATVFEAFDRRLADHAASVQHILLSRGKRMGWHDLQVATTALHHGEPLVSRDELFEVVPELELYRW